MRPDPDSIPEFAIDREGAWHHRGAPVRRESLVRLLAGMLQRGSDGRYVLISTGQRVPVDVADAPYLVTDAEYDPGGTPPCLWLITSTGQREVVDAAHPLRMRSDRVRGERRLYHDRGDGLDALVHRNVYYRLAEFAEPDPSTGRLGILSAGEFFLLE